MTDIVERLNKLLNDINMYDHYRPVIRKAAKEIERLREEVAKLHDALDRMVNPKRPDTNISVRVEGKRKP